MVLLIVAALAAILYPIFARTRCGDGGGATCRSNLKQIHLATTQYVQDFDQLPVITTRGEAFGWADALQPYLRSVRVYQCPSEKGWGQKKTAPRASGYTDYWMNGLLSGRVLHRIKDASHVILFGEGNDGTDRTDARYTNDCVPSEWLGVKSSPPHRHDQGANYALADGRVKWLKAHRISSPEQVGEFRFKPY